MDHLNQQQLLHEQAIAAAAAARQQNAKKQQPLITNPQHKREVSEPKPADKLAFTGPPRSTSKMTNNQHDHANVQGRPDSKVSKFSTSKEQPSQDSQISAQMMKALKLFAKNHQELEKVSDPEKGVNNNRRVLSYDSRRQSSSTMNVPASTFEKCGGIVPAGPKFVNDLVEKELANYKLEVEQKFKASTMNNNYAFPRKIKERRTSKEQQQATNYQAHGGLVDTAVQVSVRPQQFFHTATNQHPAQQHASLQGKGQQMGQSKETSASPQSRVIAKGLHPKKQQPPSSLIVTGAELQLKKPTTMSIIQNGIDGAQNIESNSASQGVLFTKKNIELQSRRSELTHALNNGGIGGAANSSLRCESINQSNSPSNHNYQGLAAANNPSRIQDYCDVAQQQQLGAGYRYSQTSSTELLLEEDGNPCMLFPNNPQRNTRASHGVTTLQEKKNMEISPPLMITGKGGGQLELPLNISNILAKTQMPSPQNPRGDVVAPEFTEELPRPPKKNIISNQNHTVMIGHGGVPNHNHKNKNLKAYLAGKDPNPSVKQSDSGFFKNLNQVFNKTVLGAGGAATGQGAPSPHNDETGPRNQQQHHSNGPHPQGKHQVVQPHNAASIVINKPIVIQFQNKKITFKNHHHHHHHHYTNDSIQLTQPPTPPQGIPPPMSVNCMPSSTTSHPQTTITNGKQKTSKSNPVTKKPSPCQLSPRIPIIQSINSKETSDQPHNQTQIYLQQQALTQHVKMPLSSQQQKLMVKMKKPPIQTQQQQQFSHLVGGQGGSSVLKNSGNQQIARKADVISNGQCVASQTLDKRNGGPASKKNQVNQILQQILSFEPPPLHNNTQPPSPKSFEFSTQQVQQQRAGGFEDGSLGRKFAQQTSNSIRGASQKQNSSLGRPRQSEIVTSATANKLANQIKVGSIVQNFGISKTQDSKQPGSKDGGSSIQFANGQSYMVDFNILDQLKNHTNESVSLLGGKSDQHAGAAMLLNNNSFTSNFRTQIPTGAKLILSNPAAVNCDTSGGVTQNILQPKMTSKDGQAPLRKNHQRYQTNISHTNGVSSPTAVAAALSASLTMDSVAHQNNKTTVQKTNQSRLMMQSKGGNMGANSIEKAPSSMGVNKALKKKKTSIGSTQHSMRNASQSGATSQNPIHHYQTNQAAAQQYALQQQINQNTFKQFESQAAQLAQSSRIMKKNQLSQQQQLSKMAAQDRHITQMKEQLMKVGYSNQQQQHQSSFNSPHRLSQGPTTAALQHQQLHQQMISQNNISLQQAHIQMFTSTATGASNMYQLNTSLGGGGGTAAVGLHPSFESGHGGTLDDRKNHSFNAVQQNRGVEKQRKSVKGGTSAAIGGKTNIGLLSQQQQLQPQQNIGAARQSQPNSNATTTATRRKMSANRGSGQQPHHSHHNGYHA